MAGGTKDSNGADSGATTVAIDYLKSSQFRSIRADGAIGGITPNGHIHMALYTERSAIPRRMVHEVGEDGTLGAVREIQTRNSIIREMDVDVYMAVDTAEALHTWLGERIEDAKKKAAGTN